MAISDRKENWASGDAYEPYVGRWSRPVAREFLAWLDVPPGRCWLDVGCGTGALSQGILDCCEPDRVIAIDPSEGYLGFARGRIVDERVEFRQGAAQALPVQDGQADAVVSGLVLNFVPDQGGAMAEMNRAAKHGGIVGAYVWDYAAQM